MGIPLRNNNELFNYGDYLSWPDDENWELIEGIPFNMSPAPSPTHQEISMNLSSEIHQLLKKKGGKCKVFTAPFDVRLPEKDQLDEETQSVVQPDISVICNPEKIDDKGCKGAPDFIAEIVSPSTVKIDMKFKLHLYEKHKVPEYWIILPSENTVQVYQLNDKKKYGRAEVYFKDDAIPLKLQDYSFEINLESIFL
jgi:Uma2 family endonuclease